MFRAIFFFTPRQERARPGGTGWWAGPPRPPIQLIPKLHQGTRAAAKLELGGIIAFPSWSLGMRR